MSLKYMFFCLILQFKVFVLSSFETEPSSFTENNLSKDDACKDSTLGPHPLNNKLDYRAAKRERPYFPGHAQTPSPLRRVSSNPAELGPATAHRRVEGKVSNAQTARGEK